MRTFYETLAIAMEQRGLRAVDIARKTGIYQSYFAKLKNGTFNDATWDKAIKIISALDMTPDEFHKLQMGE